MKLVKRIGGMFKSKTMSEIQRDGRKASAAKSNATVKHNTGGKLHAKPLPGKKR